MAQPPREFPTHDLQLTNRVRYFKGPLFKHLRSVLAGSNGGTFARIASSVSSKAGSLRGFSSLLIATVITILSPKVANVVEAIILAPVKLPNSAMVKATCPSLMRDPQGVDVDRPADAKGTPSPARSASVA